VHLASVTKDILLAALRTAWQNKSVAVRKPAKRARRKAV